MVCAWGKCSCNGHAAFWLDGIPLDEPRQQAGSRSMTTVGVAELSPAPSFSCHHVTTLCWVAHRRGQTFFVAADTVAGQLGSLLYACPCFFGRVLPVFLFWGACSLCLFLFCSCGFLLFAVFHFTGRALLFLFLICVPPSLISGALGLYFVFVIVSGFSYFGLCAPVFHFGDRPLHFFVLFVFPVLSSVAD